MIVMYQNIAMKHLALSKAWECSFILCSRLYVEHLYYQPIMSCFGRWSVTTQKA